MWALSNGQAYTGCARKLTSLHGLSTEAYKLTPAGHGSLQAYPGCPRKLTSLHRLCTEAYKLTRAVHRSLQTYTGWPRQLTSLPRLSTEAYKLTPTVHGAWYSQRTYFHLLHPMSRVTVHESTRHNKHSCHFGLSLIHIILYM